MGQGWICLHRKIRECDLIWDDKPFSRGQAWIDLLIQVNHEDKEVMFNARGMIIKRGQKLTSIRKLGEEWGWSRTKTKLFLDELKRAGMIDYFSDTKKTVVTVINYGIYQDMDKTKEPQKSHRKATEKPQKDTNNNDNNINNEKQINTPLPPTGGTEFSNYDYEKHSNVENAKYILNNKMYKNFNYLIEHKELWEVIKEWMEYKDKRTPHKTHHYHTEIGITKLLSQFISAHKEYGIETVRTVVNDSIAAEYSGIVWDWLEKRKKINQKTGVAGIKI